MQMIPPPPPPLMYRREQDVPAFAPVPPPPARIKVSLDTECYVDYWLASFARVDDNVVIAEFESFPGQLLDIAGLRRFLEVCTIVTFNGKSYDEPMLTAALAGYDNRALKWLSDQIITRGLKPWEFEREFKMRTPDYIDHIDLIEILPGQHGLKMYMAKMHSKKIQELPLPPDASITPEMRPLMRKYCGNDLTGNNDALRQFSKEIKLREQMSADYGLDLRSKSDAQIAEAVIKHELGFKVERPEWVMGSWFNYDPPAFIGYQTPLLCQLLEMVRGARFVLGETGVDLPPELESAQIKIGNSTYTLGIGGLHSTESKCYHISDAEHVLLDIDVDSYYPELMLNSGQFPPQMGEAFLVVFKKLVDRRLAAKYAGDKSTADTLKIVVNGTFGKTLSRYGILVAPKLGIQTTLTGQLSILMLIEALELSGVPVVSANTDGIVTKCPRHLVATRDAVVKAWQARTSLKTSAAEYAALFSRDVNAYIAVKADLSVKLKGAFAPPVPVGGSWPNPTGEICVDAVVAFLLRQVPLYDTIAACRDVRKFVYVRNVKGGGVKYYGDEINAATTQKGMREQLTAAGWVEVAPKLFCEPCGDGVPLEMKAAHKQAVAYLRAHNPVRKDYLGKVVRWYYGRGEVGAIRYKTSGNLVAKTEGATPLMDLPDEFPDNVDIEWYVREAKSLLNDLGVPMI